MTALAQKIMSELSKRPDRMAEIDRKGEIHIRCFNLAHKGGQESNPSLRIQTEGRWAGNFKCRACGFTGNWTDVAAALKLDEINLDEMEDLQIFSEDEITSASSESNLPVSYKQEYEHAWYPDTEWRGINGKYVNRAGGLLVMDRHANGLLRFPVTYHGKRKAHVDCLIEKGDRKLGYWNSPGTWSEKYLLFFDYCYKRLRKGRKTLFIVEGPRDALQVIQHGGLCVPVLGATNISEKKIRMLLELNAGLYVHMFDGDEAGDKAAMIMKGEEGLAGQSEPFVDRTNSEFVDLPRGKDPCDLPPKLVKKLIKYYE